VVVLVAHRAHDGDLDQQPLVTAAAERTRHRVGRARHVDLPHMGHMDRADEKIYLLKIADWTIEDWCRLMNVE
jgi:hypothetical protein